MHQVRTARASREPLRSWSRRCCTAAATVVGGSNGAPTAVMAPMFCAGGEGAADVRRPNQNAGVVQQCMLTACGTIQLPGKCRYIKQQKEAA